MEIYSTYATQEMRDNIATRLANSDELKKFAFEFCTAFNLRALDTTTNGVSLVTQSGLSAGHIYVQKMFSRRADERRVSYFYTNGRIITKEKGSMNSNRDTRDSVKISTLLSTMRKHNEIPSDEKILRGLCDGIHYAFNAAGAGSHYGAPRFDIDSSLALNATKAILGIEEMSLSYKTQLESSYAEYLQKMEKFNASKSEQHRFYKGCKMIAVLNHDSGKPAYLVGEVRYDISADKREQQIVFQSPLKRYATLAESPLAADALMIRTYMEGGTMNQYQAENELKLRPCDMYFQELDVAVGYTMREEFFVLIPMTAPDA
jgi:hypothetical protein